MGLSRDGEHSSGGRARRLRKALVALVGSIAVLASALPATTQALAAPSPKPAAEPSGVSFTLEGCRNDGSITLPHGSGQYVCPDGVYTSGNLGKGWAELDLVPYRVTADAGNSAAASQTYTVAYAVDNEDAGKIGYDVLSAAALNTALSVGTCAAPVIGTRLIASPGIGGISKTLYRTLTVTQSRNTTCVYDFYAHRVGQPEQRSACVDPAGIRVRAGVRLECPPDGDRGPRHAGGLPAPLRGDPGCDRGAPPRSPKSHRGRRRACSGRRSCSRRRCPPCDSAPSSRATGA